MGCLLELFFDIFVEGMFELMGWGYIKLMQLIVPSKIVSEKGKKIIRNIVTTIAVLYGVAIIVGLILFVQDDPFIKNIGKYMTYIPLALIVLQIGLGFVVRIIRCFKK